MSAWSNKVNKLHKEPITEDGKIREQVFKLIEKVDNKVMPPLDEITTRIDDLHHTTEEMKAGVRPGGSNDPMPSTNQPH